MSNPYSKRIEIKKEKEESDYMKEMRAKTEYKKPSKDLVEEIINLTKKIENEKKEYENQLEELNKKLAKINLRIVKKNELIKSSIFGLNYHNEITCPFCNGNFLHPENVKSWLDDSSRTEESFSIDWYCEFCPVHFTTIFDFHEGNVTYQIKINDILYHEFNNESEVKK